MKGYMRWANVMFLMVLLANLVLTMPGPVVHADDSSPEITAQTFLTFNTSLFEDLFDVSWNVNHWTYDLEEPIRGPGRYLGFNQLGGKFTLTVIRWNPVPFAEFQMTDASRQLIGDLAVVAGSVVGILSTSYSRIAVLGIAISKTTSERTRERIFIPTNRLDGAEPLFEHIIVDANQGTVNPDDGYVNSIPELQQPLNGGECIEDVFARYDDRIGICNAVFNSSMSGCNAAYNTTMTGCNAVFNASVNVALASFDQCMIVAAGISVLCMLGCVGLTAGWGLFFCSIVCLATAASQKAICASNFNAAIALATAIRNACVGGAVATRAACRLAAVATHEACVDTAVIQATQELEDCP